VQPILTHVFKYVNENTSTQYFLHQVYFVISFREIIKSIEPFIKRKGVVSSSYDPNPSGKIFPHHFLKDVVETRLQSGTCDEP